MKIRLATIELRERPRSLPRGGTRLNSTQILEQFWRNGFDKFRAPIMRKSIFVLHWGTWESLACGEKHQICWVWHGQGQQSESWGLLHCWRNIKAQLRSENRSLKYASLCKPGTDNEVIQPGAPQRCWDTKESLQALRVVVAMEMQQALLIKVVPEQTWQVKLLSGLQSMPQTEEPHHGAAVLSFTASVWT